MLESELLNRFQCDIQFMISNSRNDNTNIKLILCNEKSLFHFLCILKTFQESEKKKSLLLTASGQLPPRKIVPRIIAPGHLPPG